MGQGIMPPSSSNWSLALHVVPKKSGDIYPCGDYCVLNSHTKMDRYLVPSIQEFFSQLAGYTIFSRVDLVKDFFHQIPVHPDDIQKTIIITSFGLFEYIGMLFGLMNSAQKFQCFIDEVLRGLHFCFAFTDDASPDDYGIQINVDKSEFGATSLTFIGYTETPKGIAPL